MHPDPEIQAIADRYGAIASPDLKVQRCDPGASAFGLVWDGRALVATAPKSKSWGHPMGRAPNAVVASGYRWPSQGACARALGVSPAAVAKAIGRGQLAQMVARHLPVPGPEGFGQ